MLKAFMMRGKFGFEPVNVEKVKAKQSEVNREFDEKLKEVVRLCKAVKTAPAELIDESENEPYDPKQYCQVPPNGIVRFLYLSCEFATDAFKLWYICRATTL